MESTNCYKIGKTVWKFLKASGIFGGGALATITFPSEDADLAQWAIFAASVVPVVWVPLRNWYLHKNKPREGSLEHVAKNIEEVARRTGAVILLCFTLSFLSLGCSTLGQSSVYTSFSETVNDEGTSTEFVAKSRGEVDTSLHKLSYRYGGEENEIQVGQDSMGVTSPSQQALYQGIAHLVANVPGLLDAIVSAVTQQPVETTAE